MHKEKITNENAMTIDFAGEERRAFLRRLQHEPKSPTTSRKQVTMWHGCWMNDVSASDPRSVKAQLAGRISCRVLWWNLNLWTHEILHPGISVESVMYRFHQRHHKLTFLLLKISTKLQMMISYRTQRNDLRASRRSYIVHSNKL